MKTIILAIEKLKRPWQPRRQPVREDGQQDGGEDENQDEGGARQHLFFLYLFTFLYFIFFVFGRQHLVEEKVKPWFPQLVRHLVLDSEAREVPLTVVKSVALLTSGAVYCGTSLKLLSTKKS